METQKSIYDLNQFARAYIEALYFTDAGPDNEISADNELSQEAITRIETDCAKFEAMASRYFTDCTRGSGEYSVSQQAAHDFWLTRNGHGAGFWDGDWPEPNASTLDGIAKTFGECSPYLGDDGLIYLS